MRTLFVVAALLSASSFAHASSGPAWADLYSAAARACVHASGLKRSQPSAPVDFTDKVMIAVRGYWPQRHMNNAPAMLMCLYDKRTGRVEVQQAPRMG